MVNNETYMTLLKSRILQTNEIFLLNPIFKNKKQNTSFTRKQTKKKHNCNQQQKVDEATEECI